MLLLHRSDCAACRAREPVPGDRESVFYGTAARWARRSRISEQHPRHRAVLDGVSVRRRFTASSFRLWGSAPSRRLGRVTVLPQLKVDRLCSVVDGTADCDPFGTLVVGVSSL